MNHFFKIAAFLAVFALSLGATDAVHASPDDSYESVQHDSAQQNSAGNAGTYIPANAESAGTSNRSVYPVKRPALFCIQPQTTGAVHLLRILPAPTAEETKSVTVFSQTLEASIRQSVSTYLSGSQDLYSSQSNRILLFPFHYFL